jgi:hypothetical protein
VTGNDSIGYLEEKFQFFTMVHVDSTLFMNNLSDDNNEVNGYDWQSSLGSN